MFHQPESWQVGDLLRMDNKIWRVGSVSDMRMRLDPVSGFVTKVLDSEFTSYSGSVNVSPNSVLDRMEEEGLTQVQRRRVAHLIGREGTTEERTMSEATETVAVAPTTKAGPVAVKVGGVKPAVAAPVTTTVSANKKANADRLAKLKAKSATGEKKSPVAKKEKALNQCKCGCDAMVAGNFAQGHDARFKGWLLKIERGQMQVKELPARVQKAYEWKKKGEGMIPTLNYKGEKHTGYAPKDE